jgi:hypothetical protein
MNAHGEDLYVFGLIFAHSLNTNSLLSNSRDFGFGHKLESAASGHEGVHGVLQE